MFWTEPQASEQKRRPFHKTESCVLTWDGRLDNRDDLVAQLRHQFPSSHGASDAVIVAAAYARWGEDCLAKLIGDWSLALWDRGPRRLFLAVDYPGVTRPLYYRRTNAGVLWSSELRSFLSVDRALEIDDGYLLNRIVLKPPFGRTPFLGVGQLTAGQKVTFAGEAHTASVHWRPSLEDIVEYRRDEEYEAHFRHLFSRAVSDRIRNERCVWAELSGGFDSSSVVCVADELIRQYGSNAELKTMTTIHTFDSAPLDDPDILYRKVVTQKTGRASYLIEGAHDSFLYPETDAALIANPVVGYASDKAAQALMAESRATVLLTGEGGDDVMGSTAHFHAYLADRLLQGRWRELLRTAWEVSLDRKRTLWNVLRAEALRGSLFDRTYTGDRFPEMARGRAAWLNWKIVDEVEPEWDECRTVPRTTLLQAFPSKRWRSALFDATFKLPLQNRCLGAVDATHPFLDRRVLQFILAIPADQIVRPGVSRSLHKRSLAGILPPELLQRRVKKVFDPVAYRQVADQWAAVRLLLADGARIAERGYVDLPALRDRANAIRLGERFELGRFFSALSVENWLRHVENWRAQRRSP